MVRAPCCEKMGLKRGPWTPEEDQILVSHIQKFGHANWRALPKEAGLLRCGKSCRLRWTNYLRPDIKRGNFSREEEDATIQLHQMLGNRWSAIAARLPGRTDNEIKNVWHTHLKKRLKSGELTEKSPEPAACNAGIRRRESKPAPQNTDLAGVQSTTVQHSMTSSEEISPAYPLLSTNNFSFSSTGSSSMASSDNRAMISSLKAEESSMDSLDSNPVQSGNSALFYPEDHSGMDEFWLEPLNEARFFEDDSKFLCQMNMVEPEFDPLLSPLSSYQDQSMDFWLNALMVDGQIRSALEF